METTPCPPPASSVSTCPSGPGTSGLTQGHRPQEGSLGLSPGTMAVGAPSTTWLPSGGPGSSSETRAPVSGLVPPVNVGSRKWGGVRRRGGARRRGGVRRLEGSGGGGVRRREKPGGGRSHEEGAVRRWEGSGEGEGLGRGRVRRGGVRRGWGQEEGGSGGGGVRRGEVRRGRVREGAVSELVP